MAIVQKRNHIITWNEKLEIQMIILNHLYVCQGGGGGGGGGGHWFNCYLPVLWSYTN